MLKEFVVGSPPEMVLLMKIGAAKGAASFR